MRGADAERAHPGGGPSAMPRLRGERVVVTRHGREIAAIVPMGDLGLLDRLRDLARARDLDDALAELDAGASIPWRELRKDLNG